MSSEGISLKGIRGKRSKRKLESESISFIHKKEKKKHAQYETVFGCPVCDDYFLTLDLLRNYTNYDHHKLILPALIYFKFCWFFFLFFFTVNDLENTETETEVELNNPLPTLRTDTSSSKSNETDETSVEETLYSIFKPKTLFEKKMQTSFVDCSHLKAFSINGIPCLTSESHLKQRFS